MINDNLSLKSSNLDGENNSKSDEIEPLSIAEVLARHNYSRGHHEQDEDYEHDEDREHHDRDFAGSNSTSDSDPISTSAAVIKPATADIVVNYHGFSEEAKNAFEYAVTIWEGWIQSDIDIEVDAYWTDLSKYGSGVLGAASPNGSIRNFMDSNDREDYKDNTFYAMPLANHLAGKDLNGGSAEIKVWLNSDFSNWYFGTEGDTPNRKYDLTTVVLHELVHGFGLTDLISYDDGIGSYGNTIFESFIVNSDDESLDTFANHSKELGKQLTSNDLYFNGANAVEANGGEEIKLYAPGKWQNGSSIAHLDEKKYPKGDPDSLMTPIFQRGEAIHNPGAITLGVLEDLGWDINKADSRAVPPESARSKEETPSATIPILDFNSLKSYGGQDGRHTLNISADGKEFEVKGNSWKQLEIDYNITKDTILEFDFRSDKEGEIQGIGFDTDNDFDSKVDNEYFFQLSGTQKFGFSEFEYQTNSDWQSYQIRLGDYFTGGFNYLTFANDHDKGTKDAHSQFRNLSLYEEGQQPQPVEEPAPTQPAETPSAPKEEPAPTQPVETPSTTIPTLDFNFLKSYGGQDGKHTLNISGDGKEFEVKGNSWKQLEIDYNITEDTILEFDFRSDKEGEIQGIGFDTDNKFNHKVDTKYLFQLSGTQKLGLSEFEYQTNSDWQSYQIRVGDYFTGGFNYLTFANDHDKGTKDAHSQFRNLSLYEEGQQPQPVEEPAPTQPVEEPAPTQPVEEPAPTKPAETPSTTIPTLDFNFLKSYGGQDGKHTLNISADGKEFEVKGNSWKQLEVDYNITKDTILEFDFRSDKQGEIQGIGFDTDNNFNHKVDKKHLFQLSGTQKLGLSEFEYQTKDNWQSYQIRVGDYFTGGFNYLTFANDHDQGTKDAHSQFRNLRLYEEGHVVVPTLDFTPLESYGGQDGKHTLNISADGKEFEVKGNSWKQLEIDYNITKDTILEFDFRSDKEGEIQGIGFDTDNNFNHKVDKKYLFQLSGTQKLGLSEFEYQTNDNWQSYQIRVGDYFTGGFNYLTFANDHDKGTKDAHSQFRNLRLYEGDTSNFSKAESNSDLNSDVLLTVKDSTNSYNLSSYGGTTQDKGTFSISDDKTEVKLEGNSWKKLDINNYNITNNTVLKFDFQTTAEGEIQGIGFDNDDIIDGGDRAQLFQVSGTQDWGIELEDSYSLGSGWQTYEVKVGDYFTGEFDYLTLASDSDASNSTAQTQFRNISLSEM